MVKPVLAVIIPCLNEELCIRSTAERLLEVLKDIEAKDKISGNSFLYIVDDGSTDSTWSIVQELHKNNPLVKGVKFMRNFGSQKALLAGLEGARELGCDCAVSIDADLQQDENAVEKFVDEYLKGSEIVFGIRNSRKTDSFAKKLTAVLFYKTMKLLGVNMQINHSEYRLVSRKALELLKLYPEKSLFLRGFFQETGLKSSCVYFDVKPREAGKSKFNYASLASMALGGITSYTIAPLRIASILGFIMMIFGFLAGIETVIEKLVWNNSPDGLTTAIVLLCAFGGIQLFFTGIIGEYVGQLYKEVKARPRYIKDDELV